MKYYRVSPDITWRVEGEAVLAYNRVTTLVYQLNKESAFLLELCDGSRSAADLQAKFVAATDRGDLKDEIEPFCTQLTEMGVLVAEEGQT